MMKHSLVSFLLLACCATGVGYSEPLPPLVRKVGIDQRLNEQVPADLEFRDESSRLVHLGDYFRDRPVILVLAYFRCPMLCTQVLNGLAESVRQLSLSIGKDFQIVTVSIDQRETPDLAKAKKEKYVEDIQNFGQPNATDGWHFLTGEQTAIDQLAQAVGFRYAYDPQLDQFAHASGIIILTPQGRIARYLLGIDYAPRDLRFSLMEATENRIGSPVDRLLLLCYQYDPATGKYTASVMAIVRVAGAVTLGCIGLFYFAMWRRRAKAWHPPRDRALSI